MKKLLIILTILFSSCQLPDNEMNYEQGLVVFGRISLTEFLNETFGTIDTLRVSMSSQINSELDNANQLYINDAEVSISGLFDNNLNESTIRLTALGELGKYYVHDSISYKIQSNSTYKLDVIYDEYIVSAQTTTPNFLTISSIEDTYNCEECSDNTIYGQTSCENQGNQWNSEIQNINEINVNNFDYIALDLAESININLELIVDSIYGNPDLLNPYIEDNIISTIELSRFGCSVGSFASKPYFVLDIDDQEEDNNPDLSAIRILTYSLEPKKMAIEPLTFDENNDGVLDSNDVYFDFNENQIRDLTLINSFYDTTQVFKIWKGPYLRDEDFNPFLVNPHIWTVETSPTPIMWLYFNHYGKNLMVIQSSDQAYYDYLSGNPLGDNQYLLPDSNIENGYGLFTSSYSKAFFINVLRKD